MSAQSYRVTSRATAATLLLSLVLLLAMVIPAAAHGPVSDEYRSEVTAFPDDWPIFAEVKDGDDRLRVSNTGDAELMIFDYDDKPYARIGPDGVFVNTNSEAYYANDDRYGDVEIPDGTGDGPPTWEAVDGEDQPVFEFHDHRIHWMLPTPPPAINESNPDDQLILEWSIPVRYDNQAGTIEGRLDYIGGEAPPVWKSPVAWAIGAGAIAVAIIGLAIFRRRRNRAAAR